MLVRAHLETIPCLPLRYRHNCLAKGDGAVRTPCSRTKPAYATTILVIDARKNVPMPAPGAAGDVNNTANGNRKGKKPIRTKAVEIMRAVEPELKAF